MKDNLFAVPAGRVHFYNVCISNMFFVKFVAFLFLLATVAGELKWKIGFLSDIHLDPSIVREGVDFAWNNFTPSPKFTAGLKRISGLETANFSSPSDVLYKACQILERGPSILIALSQCLCGSTLKYMSSALRIPIYEIPTQPQLICPMKCNERKNVASTSPYAEVFKFSLSLQDGMLLGRFLACQTWKRMIIVYDNDMHAQSVSNIINKMENRMQKVIIQKLPISSNGGSINVEETSSLVSKIISFAMDDITQQSDNDEAFSNNYGSLLFVLMCSEETVTNFILRIIPELQYSLYIHYYIVDVGWNKAHFAHSLLFRKSVTVITKDVTNPDTSLRYNQLTAKDISMVISSSLETITSGLQEIEAEKKSFTTGHTFPNNTEALSCSKDLSRYETLNLLIANAIKKTQSTKMLSNMSQEINFSARDSFYIADLQNRTQGMSSSTRVCNIGDDGKIQCIPMAQLVDNIESFKLCNSVELQKENSSGLSPGISRDEINLEMMDTYLRWFVEYGIELENKTYKIAALEEEPFVFVRNNSESCPVFTGFSIDLLHLLSKLLRFRYEIYHVNERTYGVNKNGMWNGLIGDIVLKKADLAISAITITPQREKVVDFTKRYMDYSVGILMKKPQKVTDLFAFLTPFDKNVWISLLAGLFLVSIFIFTLNGISPRHSVPNHHDISLRGAFWFTYSSLVQQGTDLNLANLSSQIVTGVWWFFVLIIMSSYTANLAAHLTVRRMDDAISTFRELADQKELSFGTAKDTCIYELLQRKGLESPDHTSIWGSLWDVASKSENYVSTSEEGIKRSKLENYAFLWDSAVIEYAIFSDPDCSLSTVPDSIFSKGYGIAVQQGHPIRDALSLGILQLQDNGEIDRLKQKWWNGKGKCPYTRVKKRNSISELTLDDFAGVFCVLISGLVIASLMAIVELLKCLKKEKKNKDKQNASKEKPAVVTELTDSACTSQILVEKCLGDEVHILIKDHDFISRTAFEKKVQKEGFVTGYFFSVRTPSVINEPTEPNLLLAKAALVNEPSHQDRKKERSFSNKEERNVLIPQGRPSPVPLNQRSKLYERKTSKKLSSIYFSESV